MEVQAGVLMGECWKLELVVEVEDDDEEFCAILVITDDVWMALGTEL